MTDSPQDEHALFHRLSELEGEIALVEEMSAPTGAAAAFDAPRRSYEADLARLRGERADVLARLGERGRTHRIQAHNDHQRRLRAALFAYNDAARRMSDSLREAQALAGIEILLPGDAARDNETVLGPPCDFAALSKLAPAAPIRVADSERVT
jgi:hypothetical protein